MGVAPEFVNSVRRRPVLTIAELARSCFVFLTQLASLLYLKSLAQELGGGWPRVPVNIPFLLVALVLLVMIERAVREQMPQWLRASAVGWLMRSPSLIGVAVQGLIMSSVIVGPMLDGWQDHQSLSSDLGPVWPYVLLGAAYLTLIGLVARQLMFGFERVWNLAASKRKAI